MVQFSCQPCEPMVIENMPFDKYELEPSPLTQYILERRQPNTCWQVCTLFPCSFIFSEDRMQLRDLQLMLRFLSHTLYTSESMSVVLHRTQRKVYIMHK